MKTALAILLSSFLFGTALQAMTSMDLKLKHSYDDAKQEFLNLANEVKSKYPESQIIQNQIAGLSDNLSIDSLYLPSKTKKNLIVLISGQHGVEAPSGSAIQRSLIERIVSNSSNDINLQQSSLLFIHVMNPFGYKYGRRFNPNNVDLNRNAYDYENQNGVAFPGLQMKNETYEKVKHLFATPMNYFTEVTRAVRALVTVIGAGGGVMDLVEALGGQYQDPKGLYFGGSKVESETEIVQRMLIDLVPQFQNTLVMNYHTGLGSYGYNNLIATAPSKDEKHLLPQYKKELDVLNELFPKNSCDGYCKFYHKEDGSKTRDYALKGTLTQWIYSRFENQRVSGLIVPVIMEIGTYIGPVMLPKVVNENYCYQNPDKCTEEKAAQYRNTLREGFNPDKKDWPSRIDSISKGSYQAIVDFSNK